VAALLALAWAPPAAAADETGRLRVVHLSPDTPAVDVALTPAPATGPAVDPGPDLATGLGYGVAGQYRDLAPGTYALSVRAAGTPASTPPVLSTRVEVPAGSARTVVLGGRFDALALAVLPDDLTPTAPGTARVRVLGAAGSAPALDVALTDGPVLAEDLPFAAAGDWTEVPAGSRVVEATAGADRARLDVELPPGSITTLLALDAPGGTGLVLRAVPDAAAPSVVPRGAVEAGGGGPSPAVVLAGALLAAGLVLGRRSPARLAAAVVLAAALLPTTSAAPAPTAELAATGAVRVAPAAVSAPVRVRVPAIGVDAAVTATGTDGSGALVVPADPAVAGWYAGGPVPGARGPAVLAGHVDWAGRPTVFARLDRLAPGDEVLVDRADGTTARFVVTTVERYAKDAFPTAAVYGATPGAELRLITCGGDFDRAAGSYADNVVVTAR
jgi:hypothetical protein